MAAAVGWAVRAEEPDMQELFSLLQSRATTETFQKLLERAPRSEGAELLKLGNGIAAQDSVVTAIRCFTLHPQDYLAALAEAVYLGGDTDTLAAMAGGVAGAFVGEGGLPQEWLQRLEDEHKGRTYIRELGQRLYAAHLQEFGAS